MPPEIPVRTQLDEVNESIIRGICRDVELQNISYLNLFNNKIKKIQGLDSLINLKTLVLSFNELEDMDGIQDCNSLIKLDLHNNFIRTIRYLTGKDKITSLDMSHNWIQDWNMIDYVAQNCPDLKEFGMKCNPIATKKGYRSLMYNKFESIQKLDGIAFSDKDKELIESEDNVLSMYMIMDCTKE